MPDYNIAKGTVADFYLEVAAYYLEQDDNINALRWLKIGSHVAPGTAIQEKIIKLETELSTSH